MGHPMTKTTQGLRRGLMTAGFAGAAGAMLATAAQAQDGQPTDVDAVVITGGYATEALSSPKTPQPLVDTPQTITVVPDQLLAEQGRRTLRDSLRNITGISLQAGEGNPPSGDALKVRGFSARDSILSDGVRDMGNYFRDPFNADRIEVTKGPSSAYAGRGNVGGTINIVSRAPLLESRFGADLSVGTDDLYRATTDWNLVISEEAGIALRLNAMVHSADEPGRDQVRNERWAIAPSIAFGLDRDTTLVVSYLRQEQDDVPDYGLPNARNLTLAASPFGGKVAPVNPSNFYGYSTDYRKVTVDVATVRLDHRFSEAIKVRSQLRYGQTHNDVVVSAPRFVGAVTTLDATTLAVGNRKPRDQTDTIFINQTDVTFDFDTGPVSQTLVAGFEISNEKSSNRRRLDANGPTMNLFNPVLQAAAPIPYNGTRAEVETELFAVYVFDSLTFSPQWEASFGLRYDQVETTVRGIDKTGAFPGFVTNLSAEDREWSGNAALIYKPVPNASLYLAYGTAFETTGRAEIVQLAGGNNNAPTTAAAFNVDPELSQSWELGAKYDAFGGKLALTGAVFQITKTNARTPGVNPGDPPIVLDGEQQVQGFELTVIGEVLPGWNLFFGYSHLKGEVTESNNAFERGKTLDNLPEHSLSLWTSYAVTDRLTVGGGMQYMAERTSDVRQSATGNLVITAPDYTVFDAFVEYRFTDRVGLRLNVNNLTDETYFQTFASGQSVPSAARSAVLTLNLAF